MRLITIPLLIIATLATAHADDRERHESHNYIIERQQAGLVQGPPTSRLIIGRREIDVYPSGAMYEKGNLVGFKH